MSETKGRALMWGILADEEGGGGERPRASDERPGSNEGGACRKTGLPDARASAGIAVACQSFGNARRVCAQTAQRRIPYKLRSEGVEARARVGHNITGK